MTPIHTLLCIVFAVSPIGSIILYDDIKVNIFDRKRRDFELYVLASTAELKDFFERHDISIATASGVAALRLLPYIGKFGRLVPMLCDTISDQSDWRKAFTKATFDEMMHQVGESEIRS